MQRLIQVEHSTDNVLELVSPETYRCRVWNYRVSHSQLTVRIQKDEHQYGDGLYLVLSFVHYFDISLFWTGARFRSASIGECIRFMHSLEMFSRLPESQIHDMESKFAEGARLFIVENSALKMRILTLSRNLLLQDEQEFQKILSQGS